MLAHERREIAHDLRVLAERELRLVPLLDCRQSELLQAAPLGLDEGHRVQLGQRKVTPERERLVAVQQRRLRLQRARLGDQLLETREIDLGGLCP